MTKKERELIANLLEMSSDLFSGRNCNDLPDEIWEGWTEKERARLCRELGYEDGEIDPQDWEIMDLMAERLRK